MRIHARNAASHGSKGLTLLELVVVLAILSALGTVMITQSTSLAGEARYQQTVRTLEDLRDAIVGRLPAANEDVLAVAPGFVSDMGRLP
ncbi:MAG: prepilin-type N-terminal cleavage/methylation domain-containing protein, partial [Planctomycetota bacterium]